MGLCGSQEKLSKEEKNARDAEKAISKELDKKMRDESLQDNQVCDRSAPYLGEQPLISLPLILTPQINKLLLLGAGESGTQNCAYSFFPPTAKGTPAPTPTPHT